MHRVIVRVSFADSACIGLLLCGKNKQKLSTAKIFRSNYTKNPAPSMAQGSIAEIYLPIASLGQTSAHVPHSVHKSGSIEYFSPSEIAPIGHSSMQVPHAMHASEITNAIVVNFYYCFGYILTPLSATADIIRSRI